MCPQNIFYFCYFPLECFIKNISSPINPPINPLIKPDIPLFTALAKSVGGKPIKKKLINPLNAAPIIAPIIPAFIGSLMWIFSPSDLCFEFIFSTFTS